MSKKCLFLKVYVLIQANGDRAFNVQVGRTYKEVLLSARLVNGLSNVNQTPRRNDVNLDKVFLKGLIIGICTVKGINTSPTFDEGILDFIKGKIKILR